MSPPHPPPSQPGPHLSPDKVLEGEAASTEVFLCCQRGWCSHATPFSCE